ncbi:MAG: glycosyltransferase family 39 protein [Verrucomicrobiia bacterium]
MKVRWMPWLLAGLLLAVMIGLLLGPIRQDSATVDETSFQSAGYSDLKGYKFYFDPESPSLSQIWPAVPLLFMDVKLPDAGKALLDRQAGYPWTVPWSGEPAAVQTLFPQGRNSWYFWPKPEAQIFGQILVYGGQNDGETMMFAGRVMQLLVTMALGALIFVWTRRASQNDLAALVALALWVFNPNALAYGHIITTDINGALAIPLAVFLFTRFLQQPNVKTAAVAGAGLGFAFLMKFNTLSLGPICIVLAACFWKNLKAAQQPWIKSALALAAAAWLVVLLGYFPVWSPAPSISTEQASVLGVPGWFQAFRPLLIPRDFFKGVALVLSHSQGGHEAYFLGEGSKQGWWYYFPVVFALKSPLAFLVALLIGIGVAATRWKKLGLYEKTPWIAGGAYFGLAMTSSINIGVRHLLPVVPLVCVGVGCSLARIANRAARYAVIALVAWEAVVAVAVYPCFLQFFNEAAGGASNGYKYALDSNFDWGQDANRLKKFLEDRGIAHIYLDYFGTQYNIEYLKIPNTRVSADQARQIKDGWLVVSASELMRPEWAWLRESREPTARVADTLFVYQISAPTIPAQ